MIETPNMCTSMIDSLINRHESNILKFYTIFGQIVYETKSSEKNLRREGQVFAFCLFYFIFAMFH